MTFEGGRVVLWGRAPGCMTMYWVPGWASCLSFLDLSLSLGGLAWGSAG